jgi:tetratricopeptide (TPR) repeat protein
VIRAACDEAERIGDSSLIAQAHLTLGATLVGSGMPHHQEGELALHRAIAVADSVPEPFTAAASYRHLAASDALRGHYTRADRYLVAAEARGAADPSGTVEVAAVRGVSLTDQGQFDRAMSVFEQGLAADPARSHRFLPLLLAHAGRAALLNGDFVTAQKYLEESLGVANARSWAGVVAAPIALLGHVAVATAALTTAKELLDDAFARACQIGDACWETWAAHGLGLLAEAEGDPEGALVHLADAVARSEPPRAGHLWSHVWALSDATRLAQLNADDREAVWREAGLALAQRCGMQSLAARLAGVERPIVNSSLG